MYYGILHALHRELQQVGVCGVCEVNVYFPVLRAVESSEFVCKVLGSGLVVIGRSSIIREVIADGLFGYFFFEEIGFVEEKNNRGALEPSQAHYGLEEKQSFLHLVLGDRDESMHCN